MSASTPNPPSENRPAPARTVAPKQAPSPKPNQNPWLWQVVLLDDEEHTYEYVTRMMQELFGYSPEAAHKIAETVDEEGRAVCLTTHKEHAELKRDQILGYGRDKLIASCKGSMSAIIEPAPQ
jgi:ATP-dependent Clp protease adaptor protein ClpS